MITLICDGFQLASRTACRLKHVNAVAVAAFVEREEYEPLCSRRHDNRRCCSLHVHKTIIIIARANRRKSSATFLRSVYIRESRPHRFALIFIARL